LVHYGIVTQSKTTSSLGGPKGKAWENLEIVSDRTNYSMADPVWILDTIAELAVLLRNDPDLHERYLAAAGGHKGFAGLIEVFVKAGVLTPPADAQELAVLTERCWILSEQWPVNLELRGRPLDVDGIREGAALMQWILNPLRREYS
jgi:hypothetical protein